MRWIKDLSVVTTSNTNIFLIVLTQFFVLWRNLLVIENSNISLLYLPKWTVNEYDVLSFYVYNMCLL